MMNYEEMLERGYKGLPEVLKKESRFEIPILDSRIQGRVTVVANFGEVTKLLNRSPDLLAKYFLGEMGTSGEYDATRLTLKGQFRQNQIQDKLEAFVKSYVLCPECKRPDTRIVQEKRIGFLKCEACGARHSVATIKQEVSGKEQKTDLAVGDEIILQITKTGKKGDGMGMHAKYIVFVTNSREGQTVKVKIQGINRNTAFADIIQIL